MLSSFTFQKIALNQVQVLNAYVNLLFKRFESRQVLNAYVHLLFKRWP